MHLLRNLLVEKICSKYMTKPKSLPTNTNQHKSYCFLCVDIVKHLLLVRFSN